MHPAEQPAHWRERARCSGLSTDIFFPNTRSALATAKRICYQCPVRHACLVEAMVNRERWGVWGGLSDRERRRIRGRRKVIWLVGEDAA